MALKIIKPGMDSAQVIARFEAERQALALMDHPNIAKVLDAGTTRAGRPYFVMELVKGVPITTYCDEQHLTPRQRLELFVPVCQAVQHAHQKGIIHRDLKPSNVLVALYDGKPVPKVIDFGVAKAIGQQADRADAVHRVRPDRRHAGVHEPGAGRAQPARHRHAQRHLLAGRAALRAADRHDAVRRKRLAGGRASMEMLRIIREEEPPKPSTRLSSSETLPSVAANRARGARPTDEARTRGAGLDRHEVPGEGPRTAATRRPTRLPRPAALPGRRAGAGLPAVRWPTGWASLRGGIERDWLWHAWGWSSCWPFPAEWAGGCVKFRDAATS